MLHERCLILFLVISANADTRTWHQSVSLGNAEMWTDGKIACPQQKIVLPENEMVFMPHSFHIGSEINFGDNGIIAFPSSGNAVSCPKELRAFHRNENGLSCLLLSAKKGDVPVQ